MYSRSSPVARAAPLPVDQRGSGILKTEIDRLASICTFRAVILVCSPAALEVGSCKVTGAHRWLYARLRRQAWTGCSLAGP